MPLLTPGGAVAQEPSSRAGTDTSAVADSLRHMAMAPVVVTATRAERQADEVSVPVSVVGQEEIDAQGDARLTDLLAAQPSLTINNDHGSGLQMRGLGPEYTLVLLDGEPIIGRTAGTLDLDRLTTANVQRVEIVRGPTPRRARAGVGARRARIAIPSSVWRTMRSCSAIRTRTGTTTTRTATTSSVPRPGARSWVRTADGDSYAKIRMISYYEGAPDDPAESDADSRYYTFDYVVSDTPSFE